MKSLVLVAIFALCAALVVGRQLNGYQIVSIELDAEQARLLHENWDLDYITPLRRTGGRTKVVVSPDQQSNLYQFLEEHQIHFTILINDFESYVQRERSNQLSRSSETVNRGVSFTRYLRYNEINEYLEQLAKNYPKLVTLENIGKSYEGRDMLAAKISLGGSKQRPVILVDAGIHAREWIAPATALYLLNQLVENATYSRFIENVDWYILPAINPDGYEYTHTDDRLWRKTRSAGRRCYGTDANRNFGFHWNEVGASSDECSETYAGSGPFSEVEARNVRDFAIANKDKIKLYLTLHSYGEYILYPWGYTETYPDDADVLDGLGKSVAKAIKDYDGTQFIVGSSTNALYAAAGGSDDWMKGVNGVALSYTLELQDRGYDFELPPKEILSAVHETFAGIEVFHSFVEEQFAKK